MTGVDDPRRFSVSRFQQTIRGVGAGVSYLLRTPDGRRARDVRDVDVVGDDSLLPPRLYKVDAARGVIAFDADHPIVTVVARTVRQARPIAGSN